MTSESSLRFFKWFNLALFFLINLCVILFISTIRIDYTTDNILHLDLHLELDVILALTIIVLTVIFQIVLLYLQVLLMFRQPGLVEIYPENQMPDSFLNPVSPAGHYNTTKIVRMVKNVCQKSQTSVERIYLTITPIPNAFTLSLPGIGSIINIHTNIIDVLTDSELEAVIAHEIGHIRGHDSVLKLIIKSPSIYLNLSFMYLYLVIIAGILESSVINQDLTATITRIIIFAVVYAITRLFTLITAFTLFKGDRAVEMLADLHAAHITSPMVTINTLIRIGQRAEVIKVLLENFQKMELLQRKSLAEEDKARLLNFISLYPLREVDERKARILAPFIYLMGQFRILRNIYHAPLTDQDIINLSAQSVESLKRSGVIMSDVSKIKQLSKMTRDWREFDVDQNEFLDAQELHNFIVMLKTNPNKFLFESETEENFLIQEHPDIRNRILNVYDHFMLKHDHKASRTR
ncbi:MAG: M48 family metallopeptidase [Candidatus Odinarchaeota archaeon]